MFSWKHLQNGWLHGFTIVTNTNSILFQNLKVLVITLSNYPSSIWRLLPSTATSIHFSRLIHVALRCRERQAAAAAACSQLIYRFSFAWSSQLLFPVLSNSVDSFIHIVSFSSVCCQFVQSVSSVWTCKYTRHLEGILGRCTKLLVFLLYVDFETFLSRTFAISYHVGRRQPLRVRWWSYY